MSLSVRCIVALLLMTVFSAACDPFELRRPDDYAPPTLRVSVNPTISDIHTWFAFSTASSYDGDHLTGTLEFRWDHNADGAWDTPWVSSRSWVHVFPVPGIYWVRVEARDRYGQITLDSVRLETYGENTDTASFRDERDGQWYKTVRISGLTWMAENLNYGTMIAVTDTARDNHLVEKYCFNDDSLLLAPRGGHYTYYYWMEMMDYDTLRNNGICPPGWELPTNEDWAMIVQNPERSIRYFTETGISNLNLTLSGFPVRYKSWNELGEITSVDSWTYFSREFYVGYLYGPAKYIPYVINSTEKRPRGRIYTLNYSNDSIRKNGGITPVRCVRRD